MGQYYKFINLDKKEKSDRNMYPLKLTEHSYVGNDYCNDTLTLLSDKWEGDRVIHVGDYATNTDNTTTSHLISKLDREFKPNTTFFNYGEYFKDVEPDKINKKIRYVYNLDKKEYIDLFHQPIINVWYGDGEASFAKFNSFALLTACGNGQGGGDYHGVNEEHIGSWAGDHFVSSEIKLEKFKDFKKNNLVFYELHRNSDIKEQYDFNTYDGYDDEAIKYGIWHVEKLIDILKNGDRMPKYIKLDINDLTEEEKKELYSKNLKEVKYKDKQIKNEELER